MEKDEKNKRYLCVFFTSKSEKTINKKHKKVVVVKCKKFKEVEEKLVELHSATYIKSIRNIDEFKYSYYNESVNKIENENNSR